MNRPARPNLPATLCLHGLLAFAATLPALTASVDLAGPSGSGTFGRSVKALPNGNFVVTDPLFDAPGPVVDVGAVYVYTAAGALVSTLTGSTAGDQVGSGGVTVLANGKFVVVSPQWNGAAVKTGAVTFGNMTGGIAGVVSAANSLTGSKANDQVGSEGVVLLTNGNYLVRSSKWDDAAADVGALTWCSGTTGRTGAVSVANSLIGGTLSDQIGGSTVIALTNGNYVTANPLWNSTVADVGAVTWGNGTTGTTGLVSVANSLIGSTVQDYVGLLGITVLTNGNYVVISPNWDNGAVLNAGAVTWGNGNTGVSGQVSSANSLTSSSNSSRIGGGGVLALTNGNYVTGSPSWNNSTGAATWSNGNTGLSGIVSASNSFTGSDINDSVGGSPGGMVALTDGNYVVHCPNWTRPGDTASPGASAGAVTWGNGTSGLFGTASAANSLIGDNNGSGVGTTVTALPGGKFVVVSHSWEDPLNLPFVVNRGAVTFCSSAAACIGTVGPSNSLIGEVDADGRGTNYQVGSSGVTALANGNYVINSPEWGKPSTLAPSVVPRDCGAVTWAGSNGAVGTITPLNSVTGGTAFERAASQVIPLTNGNYVINSGLWDNGSATDAGAIRWCNGSTGATGPINATNSLTGSTANDGTPSITPLADGNYVVRSSSWDNPNGGIVNAGFVALCSGTSPTIGPVSATNSVLGTASGGSNPMTFDYDAPRQQLIVGRPASNLVTLWTAPAAPAIPKLNPPVLLAGGSVRISFTGIPGTAYTVITSKDLDKPYSEWSLLGTVPEISPGQFEYTSPPSTQPRRFFAVRVP